MTAGTALRTVNNKHIEYNRCVFIVAYFCIVVKYEKNKLIAAIVSAVTYKKRKCNI